MDAYIHLVALGIDDAYDLLEVVAAIDARYSDKSTELADAEVHVNDKVTRLHLLQLLQRQRHLAALGRLRLELVLVETLKDLVVG